MVRLPKRGTTFHIVFLASVFLLLCTGCSDDPALYAPDPVALTIAGEMLEVPYVLKIDDMEVSLSEYRYYFLNTKLSLDQGNEGYWDEDADGSRERSLKAQTLSALLEAHAIDLLAADHELTLTTDELEQIEVDVQGQINTLGGAKKYKEALDDAYLTDPLYRGIWKTSYHYEKLYQFYFSEGGEFHNADTEVDNNTKEQEYQTKLQAIISQKADQLAVKYGSEYDLINIDTLH